MRSILLTTLFFLSYSLSFAQDTTIIQTLTYDSAGRDYVFSFPPDDGTSYEKVLMLYNMRCKGALVSTGTQPNLGCGEWDYSCNTYIVDSTATDSLKSFHPSHIISGFSGTEFNYTNQPTYSYTQYNQQNVNYDSIISESEATIGGGADIFSHPFGTTSSTSRTQYLWTAEELMTAGLVAGEISSIRLDLDIAANEAQFLRIKMKHTEQPALNVSDLELDGFTEVYFLNTPISSGENELLFYNNFSWDGSSNLLVEFSYTNGSSFADNFSIGATTAMNMGLVSASENYNLEITGSESLILPTGGFETISNEITIAFWSYGNPDLLPTSTTIFEGIDGQNRRQANVHLPWGNSQVYWDCGNNGTYDRINKTADPENFRGHWNHWAFTKNAVSGEMKIYLNGELWHSGTGKTKPIDLTAFTLGSSNGQTRFYYGNIDEFQIWNIELDASTIADWMHRNIDASHPNYAGLVTYLKMDEGAGFTTQNNAPSGGDSQIDGQANWKKVKGENLYTAFNSTNQRPNTTFVQGVYEQSVIDIAVVDTLINNQNAIFSYGIDGTDLFLQNVAYVWQSGYEYLFDDMGEVLDSFAVATDGTVTISDLLYYRKFPAEYEIMSFVTPYGINLDLGENGKTWVFDMTDFIPVLKGDKRMLMKLGGQFQEEMDIKFLFIEGTPPRDVRRIQQIWRSGIGHGYQSIMNDDVLEQRNISLDTDGVYYKIRTMVTGHGQEGEFIPRVHEVNINGGDAEFSWQAWTSCGNNPVYPQGGTWIYDRAGWCPGAPTDLHQWDITDLVGSDDMISVDYTVTSGSGDSRYLTSHQLVTYGPANFDLDAAIVEIKRPSMNVEFDRENPVCNEPLVVIRNTGSTNLSSATIIYGVEGGAQYTYEWTGDLPFMQEEEVVLPVESIAFWGANQSGVFTVSISNPNGGQDEYSQNSTLSATYEIPDMIDQEMFVIALNTNNFGSQNSYTLKDVFGNVITEGSGFSNNTFYRDTVYLEDGCYTLELNDSGGNGLEFWAQPNQGSGSFYVRNAVQVLKVFEPDFGSTINYSFIKGPLTNIETPVFDYTFDIYPNPSTGSFEILLDIPDFNGASILVTDLRGQVIKSIDLENLLTGTLSLDLSAQPSGIYHCTIVTDSWIESKKILKLD